MATETFRLEMRIALLHIIETGSITALVARWRKRNSFNSGIDRLMRQDCLQRCSGTQPHVKMWQWRPRWQSSSAVSRDQPSALSLGSLEDAPCTRLLCMLGRGRWGLLVCFGFNSSYFPQKVMLAQPLPHPGPTAASGTPEKHFS